jgi:SulP family sulfate permease
VLLVLDQTKNLLGLKAVGGAHDHFLYRFWLTMTRGGAVHLPTLLVGLTAIAIVLVLRVIKRRLDWTLLPEFLIAVIVMAVATAAWGLDQQGVAVVGNIPAKLPAPRLPALDGAQIRDLASNALAIALLGLLEAISMAKAIAAVTGQRLDLNQQCLSEGLANLGGSFFQCMPGSGSLTRSAINQQAGAKTQWSGVVSAVAVALIMLVFAPYARFIPRSALAGLLMLTAARMVNLRELRYHVRVSRFDAAIVAVTAIAAFAISIEFCVLIGVFMSFLLAVPRTGRMLLSEYVVASDGRIHERFQEDEVCGRVLIFGLEGEMYFGAGTALEQHLDAIEDRVLPNTRVVVIRLRRARNPDAVGMALLVRCVDRLRARGLHVVLCGVHEAMRVCLEKSGLVEKLGEAEIFLEQPVRESSTMQAIQHACEQVADPCVNCPRRQPAIEERGLYYQI